MGTRNSKVAIREHHELPRVDAFGRSTPLAWLQWLQKSGLMRRMLVSYGELGSTEYEDVTKLKKSFGKCEFGESLNSSKKDLLCATRQ